MLDYEALVKQRSSEPRPYNIKDTFTDGQFIEHKRFGVGYVLLVHQPPVKISVLFSDTTRLLACRVGSGVKA